MNGEVDVSGRALIVLSIRPSHGADAVSLQAWVENDGNLPLLGMGLLWERKLEIDYPARTLSLA
jgi:hypothetical protein